MYWRISSMQADEGRIFCPEAIQRSLKRRIFFNTRMPCLNTLQDMGQIREDIIWQKRNLKKTEIDRIHKRQMLSRDDMMRGSRQGLSPLEERITQ